MNAALIGGITLAVMFGVWLASALTYFLAPQNQKERELDDVDQLDYLKKYSLKHGKEA